MFFSIKPSKLKDLLNFRAKSDTVAHGKHTHLRKPQSKQIKKYIPMIKFDVENRNVLIKNV